MSRIFGSPLSLDECISRIKNSSEPMRFIQRGGPTKNILSDIKKDKYGAVFKIRLGKSSFRGSPYIFRGGPPALILVLRAFTENERTVLKGSFRFPYIFTLLFFLIAGFGGSLFYFSGQSSRSDDALGFLLAPIAILGIFRVLALSDEKPLKDYLKSTISAKEKQLTHRF